MDESAMKWVPWEKILDMLDKKQNRKERETLETIRHNKFTIYPLNSVKSSYWSSYQLVFTSMNSLTSKEAAYSMMID